MTHPRPTPGRIVHFYLNEDLVVSPALIINTPESTDAAVLEVQAPWTPEGSYVWDPGLGEAVKRSGVIEPPEDGHVDLKVDGLIRTYRVYNAPQSDEPRAGHWMWPPKV